MSVKKTILFSVVLLAIAFAVRLVIAFNTCVISSDGPFYLSVAKDFANGDYRLALSKQYFHPLYSLLVAGASKFISNWEWAGMFVSIVLSSLGVIPLYLMARKYFAGSIAIIACLLYCFHPQGAQLSASIYTTGTHISVLLFALWVTALALETNKNLYFILSGILSFVMHLNRPDGCVFLVITVIGILFLSRPAPRMLSGDGVSTALSWKEKGVKVIYLIIPWLLMLPPYLVVVKSVSGVLGLTGKVSAETVSHIGITQSFDGLYQFIVDFIKGANPILFVFWLIGLVVYIRKPARPQPLPECFRGQAPRNEGPDFRGGSGGEEKPFKRASFIWLVFAGFMAIFAVYAFTHGRMSKRYTVPLFLMMLPWTSAGLYYVGEKISSCHTRKAIYGITIALLIVLSFFTFKPVGKDKLIEKTTGELLKKYHSSRSDLPTVPTGRQAGQAGIANRPLVIVTTLSRIAYYAGGTNITPEDPAHNISSCVLGDFMQSLKDTVRQKGVDYIVLDGRITRRFPDLEKEMLGLLGNNIKVELISPYFDRTSGDFYKVYRFCR